MNRPEAPRERLAREIRPGLWLDPGLALFCEAEKTLVLSDIHWGYAAEQRRHGNLFPAWGDEQIARRMDALLAVYSPARMIWLGDSIHGAAGRTAADAYLDALPDLIEIVLVGGNHDRSWRRERELVAEYRLGSWLFHHGDTVREVPEGCCEVIGHWHPSLTERDGAGLNLKLPVLVEQERRLIMPAFSPWSRGADWRAASGESLWVVAGKRVWKKG